MSSVFVTTDPRLGVGLAGSVGDAVFFVSCGKAVQLVKYDTPDTSWTLPFGGGTIVTTDPRTGAGLAAATGARVVYITSTGSTWLVKYDVADTAWCELVGAATAAVPSDLSEGSLMLVAGGGTYLLPPGDATSVLTSNGSGAAPSWQAPAAVAASDAAECFTFLQMGA